MTIVGGLRRAVFLDRDGTLNVEKNYLYRSSDWEWIAGAVEAVRHINALGWLAVVVTNQAGVARGYYGLDDVARLHRQIDVWLAREGAWIDGYYICPHHPAFGQRFDCDCRKPRPGMLLKAAEDFGIDLQQSFLVGDKMSDVDAARAAGVTPILVATGYGAMAEAVEAVRAADVLEAVDWIRRQPA